MFTKIKRCTQLRCVEKNHRNLIESTFFHWKICKEIIRKINNISNWKIPILFLSKTHLGTWALLLFLLGKCAFYNRLCSVISYIPRPCQLYHGLWIVFPKKVILRYDPRIISRFKAKIVVFSFDYKPTIMIHVTIDKELM